MREPCPQSGHLSNSPIRRVAIEQRAQRRELSLAEPPQAFLGRQPAQALLGRYVHDQPPTLVRRQLGDVLAGDIPSEVG
jgi:hypothetical protein